MMPYVQKNLSGLIIGVFANLQPGYAEEWLPANDESVVAYEESSPFFPIVIYKADIWRRATDAEAVTIDAQLNAQPVRLRRMWQDSQMLSTSDEMYPIIKTAFIAAFGRARADVLLAPSA